jgi:hypothetical protein
MSDPTQKSGLDSRERQRCEKSHNVKKFILKKVQKKKKKTKKKRKKKKKK